MHSEPNKHRKGSPDTTESGKDALFVIRLELMRLPNIKKLKPERLTALSTNILTGLHAKGYLAIDLGNITAPDEVDATPERKLQGPASGSSRG